MSFEPVDFFITDSTPQASPVEGVLVKVYNQSGDLFFTQGTTDALGKVSFLLDTLTYSARFYKFQVGFIQPQVFEILAPPATNQFNAKADLLVPPIALDPRYCRASGFFRNVNGSPQLGVDLHFEGKFAPILVDGAATVDTKDIIRTDADGYAQIDLVRGGEYLVVFQGLEDCPRSIKVPDLSSCSLPNLLFPIVNSVSFSPVGPFALTIGTTLDVVPTVADSAGVVLEPATGNLDVAWSVEDESIAVVAVAGDKLTLRGVATGTTNLLAERKNQSIVSIPNLPIEGQPVAITVA